VDLLHASLVESCGWSQADSRGVRVTVAWDGTLESLGAVAGRGWRAFVRWPATDHAVIAGEGAPAVVFDGGIANLCGELQKRIASVTTVVTYDRAGYGPSEAGPSPRDSRTEANELRALLSGLGIPSPYVLVGHSLGCLNVEVYADLHPDEVADMVLLDPPPLSFILGQEYARRRQ
jgi:pimeloyl-ACP methyl ester carboxylesterase